MKIRIERIVDIPNSRKRFMVNMMPVNRRKREREEEEDLRREYEVVDTKAESGRVKLLADHRYACIYPCSTRYSAVLPPQVLRKLDF